MNKKEIETAFIKSIPIMCSYLFVGTAFYMISILKCIRNEHCIKEQEIMRERGADMLGWTLDDLITQTIEALKTFRP